MHGYGLARSRTHPYLAERVGAAWRLHDAPRRDPRKYRREEWVAHGVEPEVLAQLAKQHSAGWYTICVVRSVDEDSGPIRQAYKELGFRLNTTEPFLHHPLTDLPVGGPTPIELVISKEQPDRLRALGGPKISPEAYEPGGRLRQYVAFDEEAPIGWVGSIEVHDGAGVMSTWCSDLFVVPEHRRRGIGRSLMARLLLDDRTSGARSSVLSASNAGARLYPGLGYEPIGELLNFTPIRPVRTGQ